MDDCIAVIKVTWTAVAMAAAGARVMLRQCVRVCKKQLVTIILSVDILSSPS